MGSPSVSHAAKNPMTKEQRWELAIALLGVVYIGSSLVGGLQSPILGLLLVAGATMKLLLSLWVRRRS